jgi:hypothetical protein
MMGQFGVPIECPDYHTPETKSQMRKSASSFGTNARCTHSASASTIEIRLASAAFPAGFRQEYSTQLLLLKA